MQRSNGRPAVLVAIACLLGEVPAVAEPPTGSASVTAPPIDIGTLKIRQVRVTFADMFVFGHLNLTREPTLLLGMDVLGSFDVLVIDYRMREMQIRTRSPSPAQN